MLAFKKSNLEMVYIDDMLAEMFHDLDLYHICPWNDWKNTKMQSFKFPFYSLSEKYKSVFIKSLKWNKSKHV